MTTNSNDLKPPATATRPSPCSKPRQLLFLALHVCLFILAFVGTRFYLRQQQQQQRGQAMNNNNSSNNIVNNDSSSSSSSASVVANVKENGGGAKDVGVNEAAPSRDTREIGKLVTTSPKAPTASTIDERQASLSPSSSSSLSSSDCQLRHLSDVTTSPKVDTASTSSNNREDQCYATKQLGSPVKPVPLKNSRVHAKSLKVTPNGNPIMVRKVNKGGRFMSCFPPEDNNCGIVINGFLQTSQIPSSFSSSSESLSSYDQTKSWCQKNEAAAQKLGTALSKEVIRFSSMPYLYGFSVTVLTQCQSVAETFNRGVESMKITPPSEEINPTFKAMVVSQGTLAAEKFSFPLGQPFDILHLLLHVAPFSGLNSMRTVLLHHTVRMPQTLATDKKRGSDPVTMFFPHLDYFDVLMPSLPLWELSGFVGGTTSTAASSSAAFSLSSPLSVPMRYNPQVFLFRKGLSQEDDGVGIVELVKKWKAAFAEETIKFQNEQQQQRTKKPKILQWLSSPLHLSLETAIHISTTCRVMGIDPAQLHDTAAAEAGLGVDWCGVRKRPHGMNDKGWSALAGRSTQSVWDL